MQIDRIISSKKFMIAYFVNNKIFVLTDKKWKKKRNLVYLSFPSCKIPSC